MGKDECRLRVLCPLGLQLQSLKCLAKLSIQRSLGLSRCNDTARLAPYRLSLKRTLFARHRHDLAGSMNKEFERCTRHYALENPTQSGFLDSHSASARLDAKQTYS
ncbi:hypothetical protein [Mesorhizobium sp. SARCC-RB16n]|uniref:hypothetical protein n=1 Tax=Mesorhizobium sp. SARCC-RB16n TaxID=2116687 RepID=UPI00122ED4BB|nr:hypothetical protein [Mesorhizobium sp. SARCC-RB16n]